MDMSEMELITRLAHELSVALEMSYDPIEIRELWGDALEALEATKEKLNAQRIAVPAAIENVITLAKNG